MGDFAEYIVVQAEEKVFTMDEVKISAMSFPGFFHKKEMGQKS